MKESNRNLVVRVVSALVILPVVLTLVALGGWWAAGLMAVAAAICTAEYYTITQGRLTPAAIGGVLAALLLPLLPAMAPGHAGDYGFWVVAAVFFWAWSYHLLRGPLKEAPTLAGHLVTGMLYGSLGMTALSELRLQENGLDWVVCAMFITWMNDTAAYFAGRTFGKHKLYPAVSPNKTWEGFIGGWFGSVGGLFFYKFGWFPELTVVDALLLGSLGALAGPAGDLCESMLKRSYGVKDSGKIMPGHGGLLDRIDALLFNGPVTFVYVEFIRRLW